MFKVVDNCATSRCVIVIYNNELKKTNYFVSIIEGLLFDK